MKRGLAGKIAHAFIDSRLTPLVIIAIPVIFFHHLLVKKLQYLLAVTEQSLLVIYNRELNEHDNITRPHGN